MDTRISTRSRTEWVQVASGLRPEGRALINGQLVANPTHTQMSESDLDLVYVGNEHDLVMYEGSAEEISEADFNAALKFGQEAIQPTIAAQKDLVARAGKAKRQITLNIVPQEILQEAKALAGDRIVTALLTPGKLARENAVSVITEEISKKLIEKFIPKWDLTHVIDTSGAYIPGHGTPTVILFGRNRRPVASTIRTVMGIRGEPSTPDDPAQGQVWTAIVKQIDRVESQDEFVSTADVPRTTFSSHPWSIGGGGPIKCSARRKRGSCGCRFV